MPATWIHPDVAIVIETLDRLGLASSSAAVEPDNAAYGSAIAMIGRSRVRFRVGKLTPIKVGAFATVWRRSVSGSTEPLPAEDDVSLLVISVREASRFGAFVFPTAALVEHGIVSVGGAGGKRGFRVYPPWSAASNRQAVQSQRWQCGYFFEIADGTAVDAQEIARLFVWG